MELESAHILVIDDDPHMFNLIKFYLSSEPYKLEWAKNGRHALHILQDHSFDMILLDVLMPEMDGITLIKHLKDRYNSNTIIILVTAHGPEDHLMQTLKDGIHDILQKPFTANRLKLTVRNGLKYKFLNEAYSRLKKATEKL